jgi:2-phosphoglycerate kinase
MRSDVRVLLIGGTSNTGKTTVAQAAAGRLGFEHLSTDALARHPGRPWRTPDREVPAHVADHYRTLTVDELTGSVLAHYERLWPRIAALIAARAGEPSGPGLVLEGSALWPARVATLGVPHVAAVWLTSVGSVIRDRIRTAGRYTEATEDERLLMDAFLARSLDFQDRLLAGIDAFGSRTIDSGTGASVAELVDAVLAAT